MSFPVKKPFVFPTIQDERLRDLFHTYPKIREDIEILLQHHHNQKRLPERIYEQSVQRVMEIMCKGGHKTCDAGVVDIYTDEYIVEIKWWPDWHESIGQIHKYGRCFPEHQLYICLFGNRHNYDTCIDVINDSKRKVEMFEFEEYFLEYNSRPNPSIPPSLPAEIKAPSDLAVPSSHDTRHRMACRSHIISHNKNKKGKIVLAPPGEMDCKMCQTYYIVSQSVYRYYAWTKKHPPYTIMQHNTDPSNEIAERQFTELFHLATQDVVREHHKQLNDLEYVISKDLRLPKPHYER